MRKLFTLKGFLIVSATACLGFLAVHVRPGKSKNKDS